MNKAMAIIACLLVAAAGMASEGTVPLTVTPAITGTTASASTPSGLLYGEVYSVTIQIAAFTNSPAFTSKVWVATITNANFPVQEVIYTNSAYAVSGFTAQSIRYPRLSTEDAAGSTDARTNVIPYRLFGQKLALYGVDCTQTNCTVKAIVTIKE